MLVPFSQLLLGKQEEYLEPKPRLRRSVRTHYI
jgi:hypothetical protein